jgi:hypothetical protein
MEANMITSTSMGAPRRDSGRFGQIHRCIKRLPHAKKIRTDRLLQTEIT